MQVYSFFFFFFLFHLRLLLLLLLPRLLMPSCGWHVGHSIVGPALVVVDMMLEAVAALSWVRVPPDEAGDLCYPRLSLGIQKVPLNMGIEAGGD